MVKFLTVDWVQKHILSRLSKKDKAAVEKEIEDLLGSKSLAANTLSYKESLKMFDLQEKEGLNVWSLKKHQRYKVPPALTFMMNEIDFVTKDAVDNETLARVRINTVLITCIAEEKRFALCPTQVQDPILSASSSRPASSAVEVSLPSSRPTTPVEVPLQPKTPAEIPLRPGTPIELPPRPATPVEVPLILQFETKLNFHVTYKKQSRLLQGIADYTLWYDKDESMATNLIMVEAKRKGAISEAEGQIVAYMGMVHRIRQQEQKLNRTVYGVTTDGNQFRFWRIDNTSQLNRSALYEFEYAHDQREIVVSFLRLIVRAAIQSSPTTNPIKGAAAKQVVLDRFEDLTKAESFDFDIGMLEWDENEPLPCDVEILG